LLAGAEDNVHPLRVAILEGRNLFTVVGELQDVRGLRVPRELCVPNLVTPRAERRWRVYPHEEVGTATPPVGATTPPITYVFFSTEEAAFIEAAVSRLIPADEQWPGALEAAVPNYIDEQLAGAWGRGERLYRSGPWQQGTPSQGYQLRFTPAELFHTALAAINPAANRGRILFVGLLWLGACAGRVMGAFVDGSPGLFGWLSAAFELAAGLVLVVGSQTASDSASVS